MFSQFPYKENRLTHNEDFVKRPAFPSFGVPAGWGRSTVLRPSYV
jgi:hypothetical protein